MTKDALIERFKSDLSTSGALDIVNKHVIAGPCFGLGIDKDFELRNDVAKRFSIHISEVIIVGSGKLGFSINPHKELYRHFNHASDVDVAIVSESLFDLVWRDLYEYSLQNYTWADESSFKDYLFKGWLRPDKLPTESRYNFGIEWWEYFNQATASGKFGRNEIRAGIYKSLWFLERYQVQAVENCKQKLSLT